MRRLWAVVVIAIGFASMPTAALAQPELAASLRGFDPWVVPGENLTFTLDVRNSGNETAANLLVSISFQLGIQTRSGLQASFEGGQGNTVAADTVAVEGEIPPGATRTLTVTKPLDEIGFFRFAPSRAYPTRITVISNGVQSGPIATYMIFFREPEDTPLGLALVIPIDYPTVFEPDTSGGAALPQVGSQVSAFIEALQGPVETIISAVEDHPDAAVTLAPSGAFLQTLGELSRGYTVVSETEPAPPDGDGAIMTAVLDRLKVLVARPNVSFVTSPFSGAFLPALGEARAQAQIAATTLSVSDLLGTDPAAGWLLPTPALLDDSSASLMQRAGTRNLLLDQVAVIRPTDILTPATPVSISVLGSPMTALIPDEGLGQLIDPASGSEPVFDVIARQRILADTSTIMLERPAIPRVLTVVAPTDWRVDSATLRGLLSAMSDSPWLRGKTVQASIDEVEATTPVQLRDLDSIDDVPSPSDGSYLAFLRQATTSISDYADIGPDPERLVNLERRLFIAESARWWSSRATEESGLEYARSITREIATEFSLIKAPAPQTITLTSQTGVVPLSITSGVDYEIDLFLRLDSTSLQFPEAERCPRSTKVACLRVKLRPRTQTIEVEVIAEATGTGALNVSLLTPRRGVVIDSSRLFIRSTAYNVVGVSITVGAAAFLILWWFVGLLRRRIKPANA